MTVNILQLPLPERSSSGSSSAKEKKKMSKCSKKLQKRESEEGRYREEERARQQERQVRCGSYKCEIHRSNCHAAECGKGGRDRERENKKLSVFFFGGGVGERGSQKCVIQFHIKPNKPREKCEEKVKINARRVAKRSTKSAQGCVAE